MCSHVSYVSFFLRARGSVGMQNPCSDDPYIHLGDCVCGSHAGCGSQNPKDSTKSNRPKAPSHPTITWYPKSTRIHQETMIIQAPLPSSSEEFCTTHGVKRTAWRENERPAPSKKGRGELLGAVGNCSILDLHGVRPYVPRAPVPYPQVRWLDPPGTHPNHLRNRGGWSPRACRLISPGPGPGCRYFLVNHREGPNTHKHVPEPKTWTPKT